ncbi:AFG1-like ATPase-domain-containing protein [Trametes polyzona]|nr:AFG1-like ATPase-domain-containing protein [Trametes polyzona]
MVVQLRRCSQLLRRATVSRQTSLFSTAATLLSEQNSVQANLPAQIDLLERYRGLVALCRIKEDEEQIRVIMQLRRLHKELDGYAPPAVLARHLNQTHTFAPGELPAEGGDSSPWWAATDSFEQDRSSRGLIRIRTHAEEIEALDTPKGLLITGPPGSGKSFLIDLWFSTLPTPYKARKHYNELVLEIYRAVWEETRRRMTAMYSSEARLQADQEPEPRPWNKLVRDQWRQHLKSGSLPIRWTRRANMSFSLSRAPLEPSIAYVVAQRLILRHWLLVFDEIQLLDVSSATLLADVMSWFWRMGGIIVGSSNKVPDDLYKNGVQRERLEPFVEALKARCPVVVMQATQDWRAVRGSEGRSSWYTKAQLSDFQLKLKELSGEAGDVTSTQLSVFGRVIHVPWSAGDICKFTFSELCDASLGPADYITLASRYRTFVITSIPILKLSAKNQARRFISLIDALYEARCRILCLAEASPEELFFPDAPPEETAKAKDSHGPADDVDVMMAEAVGETQDVYRPNVASYDAPNMERERTPAAPLALDKLSIFSGKDEQFAFKRALSRLLEMTSESYARDETWNPLPPSARKWETPTSSSTPSAPSGHHKAPSQIPSPHEPSRSHDSDRVTASPSTTADFAEEAAPHGAQRPHPADRPPAPRLSADHIWGVREDWGDRARVWGRGASVYASSPPPAPPARSPPTESSGGEPGLQGRDAASGGTDSQLDGGAAKRGGGSGGAR